MIKDSDIPEPDVPPEPIDPELERLLEFFIKKNRRLAWMRKCDRLAIVPVDNPKNKKEHELRIIKIRDM